MSARRALWRQLSLWMVCAVVLLAVFVWLENRPGPVLLWPRGEMPVTHDSRETTDGFVRSLPPVDVAVYANPQSRVGRLVNAFLAPFTRKMINGQPAVRVQFVDPASHPARVRMNKVDVNGEMLLRLRDASAADEVLHVQALDKELFLNTWWRLAEAAKGHRPGWIFVAQGNGARAIDETKSQNIGRWVRSLQKGGYRVGALSISQLAALVQDQTQALIVFPAPVRHLPADLLALISQEKSSLRFLWLAEPDTDPAGGQLQLAFGMMSLESPGQAQDGHSQLVGLDGFTQQPLVKNMPAPVVMPDAVAFIPLSLDASESPSSKELWQPLLANSEGQYVAWLRPHAAVVGDADFVSNAYVGQGGNQVFAARLLDALLDWPHHVPPDSGKQMSLVFTQRHLLIFSLLLLFGVPLAFVFLALWRWWAYRRRLLG